MLAQYNAPRYVRTGRTTAKGYPVRVGTVPIGTIVHVVEGYRTHTRPASLGRSARDECRPIRHPYIVEAWLNREYHPGAKGRPTTYLAGGHLAVVRSLRTGKVSRIADHILRHLADA